MPFREAVEATTGLEDAFRPGLEALRARDRACIQCGNTRQLRGSVDLDTALMAAFPNDNRWDYAIAYGTNEAIYWVEIHTGDSHGISEVTKKGQWLRQWLQGNGHGLNSEPRNIVWVSSGPTTFTKSDPKLKLLAAAGVRHVGSRLRIE